MENELNPLVYQQLQGMISQMRNLWNEEKKQNLATGNDGKENTLAHFSRKEGQNLWVETILPLFLQCIQVISLAFSKKKQVQAILQEANALVDEWKQSGRYDAFFLAHSSEPLELRPVESFSPKESTKESTEESGKAHEAGRNLSASKKTTTTSTSKGAK